MSRMIDGFTTMHDIADICMIYNDCKDYKIKVWDPETQKHYALRFVGTDLSSKTVYYQLLDENAKPDGGVMPEKTVDSLYITYRAVKDWCTNNTDSWYYDAEYKVVLMFPNNQEDKYRLVFTGSSNPDKTVHFNIVRVKVEPQNN